MNRAKSYTDPKTSPWVEMLDEIENTLTENLAAADARERLREQAISVSEACRFDKGDLRRELTGLRRCLEQAEKSTADADTMLAASLGAVREWLDAVEALQQRLATWESASV